MATKFPCIIAGDRVEGEVVSTTPLTVTVNVGCTKNIEIPRATLKAIAEETAFQPGWVFAYKAADGKSMRTGCRRTYQFMDFEDSGCVLRDKKDGPTQDAIYPDNNFHPFYCFTKEQFDALSTTR